MKDLVTIGPISKTQLRTALIVYLYKRNLDQVQWWFVNPGSDNADISLVWTKGVGTDFLVWTKGLFSNPEISTGNKRVRINGSSLYPLMAFDISQTEQSLNTAGNKSNRNTAIIIVASRWKFTSALFSHLWEKYWVLLLHNSWIHITPCPDDVWRIFDCYKHKHWTSQRYSMTYRAWNQHA